jgi:hypothetical protein
MQSAMSKPSTKETPDQVKPAIDVEVLESISAETLQDGYVYVHALIRIWKTTFLIDRVSGSRSKLIHVENISFAPVWTMIADQRTHTFLLIFEALPKSCKVFDLVEEITQPGGFHVENIHRNPTDVYHIDL